MISYYSGFKSFSTSAVDVDAENDILFAQHVPAV